jgi:hypothetical protein
MIDREWVKIFFVFDFIAGAMPKNDEITAK